MAKTKHRFISHSPQETMTFAQNFAKNLRGGEIISLSGNLGGGKTTFVKGLAEELMVNEPITSPTFVIMKVYPAKIDHRNIQLVHIDAYRVESIEDIKSVGIEDYLGRSDVVMVVEWAEKIKSVLPKNSLNLNFDFSDEDLREITYDSND